MSQKQNNEEKSFEQLKTSVKFTLDSATIEKASVSVQGAGGHNNDNDYGLIRRQKIFYPN